MTIAPMHTQTPAERVFPRLMADLNTATGRGIHSLTLYLAEADFRLLCERVGQAPDDWRQQKLELTAGVPIVIKPRMLKSVFIGIDRNGHTAPFPVTTDEAYVRQA
ncbi:hypothetical protein AEAC466_13540 [Asticcacaulis sp. AC466]|uniref:hypothetical protein n=1 Tax=Asticcacaulis sp. AC466 TaxID=1282362 RepID=UPI0003C3B8A3|nr:hypothetical protein [Asticcacaulis sp. AC466]ESQ83269.1 hypothetical protein AEAC466_13540 [Asticcacaulis sp. AC466]